MRSFLHVAFVHLSLALAGVLPGTASAATILALGDSLTAGYGLAEADGFVPRLDAVLQEMGRDVTVINGGVSGDTSAGGLSRLDWSLQDRPEVMILELGANDMLRGIDPKSTRANLEAIVVKAKDMGITVVLAGMAATENFDLTTRQSSMPSIPISPGAII
jgi:acyl-CoA thioesterase-1